MKKVLRTLYLDAGRQAFIWLSSAGLTISVALSAKKEGQHVLDALLKTGFAWAVFLSFGAVFFLLWLIRTLHAKIWRA